MLLLVKVNVTEIFLMPANTGLSLLVGFYHLNSNLDAVILKSMLSNVDTFSDIDHESGTETFTSCASSKNSGVSVDMSFTWTLPKCGSNANANIASPCKIKASSNLEISVSLNSAITQLSVAKPEKESVSADSVTSSGSSNATSCIPDVHSRKYHVVLHFAFTNVEFSQEI